MNIPDATEADYERDAGADYKYLKGFHASDVGVAWIRCAVAAEKWAKELDEELDEVYRRLSAVMLFLNPPPETSKPEPGAAT